MIMPTIGRFFLVRPGLQYKKRFLQDSSGHAAKFLAFLLCFNILLTGSNHVICMEMSGEGIAKAHFQLYECQHYQTGKPTTHQSHHLDFSHRFLFTDIRENSRSCPQCVDEHILFKKSSAEIDFSPANMQMFLLPPPLNFLIRYLPASGNSSVPREHYFPLSFFSLPAIRAIILLI